MASSGEVTVDTAARRFAAITELMMMVGDYLIRDQESLHRLCLVNSYFNGIFTPYLYRTVTWREPHPHHDNPPLLAVTSERKETHLYLTRVFEARFKSVPRMSWDSIAKSADLIQSALQPMGNVEIVRLVDIPSTEEWIFNLKLPPKARELAIQFGHGPYEPPQLYFGRLDHINLFLALRTLILRKIPQERLAAVVPSIFLQSCNLENVWITTYDSSCSTAFSEICLNYSQLARGMLLDLKRISLGPGTHLPLKIELEQLTHLAALQRVDVDYCDCDSSPREDGFLDLFETTATPNLQQIELNVVNYEDMEDLIGIYQGRRACRMQRVLSHPTLSEVAEKTRVPMLQLNLCLDQVTDFAGVFGGTSNCPWLTHLNLGLILFWDARGLGQEHSCSLALCDALTGFPNLLAVRLDANDFLSMDLANIEELDVIGELCRRCQKLEYVEFFGLAYAIRRRPTHSHGDPLDNAIATLLSDYEKQIVEPEFFVDGRP